MTRFILSLALAAAPALPAYAAPVDAPQQLRFTRDGNDYVATVRESAAGQRVSGYELRSGARFELRVARGHVSGTYADMPVSYDVPAAGAPMQTALEISAR